MFCIIIVIVNYDLYEMFLRHTTENNLSEEQYKALGILNHCIKTNMYSIISMNCENVGLSNEEKVGERGVCSISHYKITPILISFYFLVFKAEGYPLRVQIGAPFEI